MSLAIIPKFATKPELATPSETSPLLAAMGDFSLLGGLVLGLVLLVLLYFIVRHLFGEQLRRYRLSRLARNAGFEFDPDGIASKLPLALRNLATLFPLGSAARICNLIRGRYRGIDFVAFDLLDNDVVGESGNNPVARNYVALRLSQPYLDCEIIPDTAYFRLQRLAAMATAKWVRGAARQQARPTGRPWVKGYSVRAHGRSNIDKLLPATLAQALAAGRRPWHLWLRHGWLLLNSAQAQLHLGDSRIAPSRLIARLQQAFDLQQALIKEGHRDGEQHATQV